MKEQNIHVLVVEDEPAHAYLVRRAFEPHLDKYRLTVADSLQSARACLDESLPDILIIDLLLPDGRGTELLPSSGAGCSFPVIVMTGYGDEQIAVEAMKAGALDYVVKSDVTFSGMPSIVERALREWRHITERKRAEKKIAEQLHFLQTFINTIPSPIFYKDAAGRYTGCNKAFEDFVGMSAEEIIGKTVYDMGPKEIVERYYQKDQELFANPGKQRYEWQVKSRNGELRNVIFNKATIQDMNCKVEGLIGVISDITERVQAEEQIKAALAEKEVLLREVHHRVKNNLQALIYLIEMQAEVNKGEEVRHALKDLQGRVRAMGLVHEKLYQAKDLARIDFSEYLEDLTSYLLYALGAGRSIALNLNAAGIFININTAIPCGMIVTELVTNALKHAFPEDREGEIGVEFRLQQGEYVLTVSDNGVGLPPELAWRATDSLGLKLVNIWATYQLEGNIEVNTQNGTAFTIRFTDRKQGGLSAV